MRHSARDRRAFLRGAGAAAVLAALGVPGRRARAALETRREGYSARTSLLYGLLNFATVGAIDERVDQAAGRYEIAIVGQGAEMTTRVESEGVLRAGRWTPVRTTSRFVVYGRESRMETQYDLTRRTVGFHSRQETFLLRRVRVVDDTVALPDAPVDDVLSAILNYAEGRWSPEADGTLRTLIVRRQRRADEGPDDVDRAYRAEIVPLVLRVKPDPQTGKPSALFDLTRFSSWARESEPARIVFGPDRRPEAITCSLILGTTVTIRMGPGVSAEHAPGATSPSGAERPAR
jgi:hypothetical protein